MKNYSNFSGEFCDSFESTSRQLTRNRRVGRNHVKIRSGSNTALNNSCLSGTTDSSILKHNDFFSLSGKPPRVPLLRTNQIRAKERANETSTVDCDNDKYHFSEYQYFLIRKHEIIRSRQVHCAQFPFWYLDNLSIEDSFLKKTKESNRPSNFLYDELGIANSERADFNNWVCGMYEKVN